MTPNVVFDCMILIQAAANALGEAGRCYATVEEGLVQLVMSQATRYETHDVLTRVKVRQKLPSLTDERVAEIFRRFSRFNVNSRWNGGDKVDDISDSQVRHAA